MNPTLERISAIAGKEWKLNTRFIVEYFAANVIGPVKTAILMYFIYSGFLKGGTNSLGALNGENFIIFVLVGTTCHTLVSTSTNIFRSRMVMEKWWQTVIATLVSPASTLEVILGFVIGSGVLHFGLALCVFGVVSFLFPIPWTSFLIAFITLFFLTLFAFGLGLIGATLALCFEGRSFFYDYTIQALMFLSCYYYPIETLPKVLHPVIQLLPTYQGTHLIQTIFMQNGYAPQAPYVLSYLICVSLIFTTIPITFFESSLKKHGIVGY